MNMPNKQKDAKVARDKKAVAVSAEANQKKIATATRIKMAVLALVVLAVIIYVVWDVLTGGPLNQLYHNRDELANYIKSMGILGPLAYILLQIAQTVFAPIPGNVVGGVGGFIFGWWGILWTVIGSAIGFWIVFVISRRFGRPLVERIIKNENLEKFDFIVGKRAPVVLFVIFLIPGLPDDIVAYIAGLTEVKIKNLVVLAILGRLPSVIVTNYIGMGLGEGSVRMVGIISAIVVLVLALIYWQRERLMNLIRKFSKDQNEPSSPNE